MTTETTDIQTIENLLDAYKRTQDSGKKRVLHIKLIEYTMPLVKKLAIPTAKVTGQPKEDLLQAGTIGLIKAIERYKPINNAKFTTYATYMIKGEIRHYLRDKANLIKAPRKSTPDYTVISLDYPNFEDEDSTFIESVQIQDYKDEIDKFENRILLNEAIAKLPKELRQIIKDCYYNDLTQKEIADEMSLSPMQVSRKLKRALNKLYSIIQDTENFNSKGE